MDELFYRNAARLADLVLLSDILQERFDAMMEKARRESDMVRMLVRKSKAHCEDAELLFDRLGRSGAQPF